MQNPIMQNPPLIMHVNYGEPEQDLARTCDLAARLGFDGVEFRRKRFDVEETETEYLDALESALSPTNLKEILFGYPGPNLTLPDKSERAREIESAAHFYETARARFGAALFNTFAGDLRNPDAGVPHHEYSRHGSGAATAEIWEWAVEGLQQLGAHAVENDYRLALETHPCYLHDTLPATRKLTDAVACDAVGVLLDYANFLTLPAPPSSREAVQTLGEKCFYVHLKNLIRLGNGEALRVALADGEVNNRELLGALKTHGYHGALCIEAPRSGDRHRFAREDLEYLQDLLNGLN